MSKSDINWRDVNEDRSFSLQENLKREILVETDITLRFAIARDIDLFDYYMDVFQEYAQRYAYLD
jgi:hypothetical protein